MTMTKTRIIRSLLAVFLAAAVALTGCSKGSESNGQEGGASAPAGDGGQKKKVTITLLTFAQPHEQELTNKLIKKYEEKYPHVKVNYIPTPPADYNTKLQSMLTGGNPPDVFYVAPENLAFLLDTNQLYDITDFVNSSNLLDVDNIWKKGIEKYTRDGRIWALPKDVGPFAYAYNKTLFDKAGIPAPPSDKPLLWPEYIEIAQKLTIDKNGNNATSPNFDPKNIVQYGAGFWWHEPAVWSSGADYVDETGTKITIDDPKFIEALTFVRDLRHKYHVVPSAEEEQSMNSYTRWLNGTVAMFPMGPWDQAAFWELPFDYDLMPWPANPRTGQSATWLGSVGFGVSSKTKAPQEAFNLVAFLSIDPDIQREAMQLGLQVPNLIDMAKNEYLKMDKKPKSKQVFIDVIEKYGRDQPFERTYDREWFDRFNAEVTQVWDGKKEPEEFVKEIQPVLQELLDKANAKKQKSQSK